VIVIIGLDKHIIPSYINRHSKLILDIPELSVMEVLICQKKHIWINLQLPWLV